MTILRLTPGCWGRILLVLLASTAALAHDRYILPSHTVLSGETSQKISLTASISNDIFHPDRALGDNGKGTVPPRLQDLFDALQARVILPDGTSSAGISWQAFSRFSAADLELTDSGTYRVSLVQPEFRMTTFQKADGTRSRIFGTKTELPAGATQVVRRTIQSRVESFVTFNQPSKQALQPVGNGLEMAGKSHPNDLFVDEKAQFQLFFNGKALTESASLTLVRGGTRHRNQRDIMTIETDKQGVFDLRFDKAGFYLLHAEITLPGTPDSDVDKRHFSLYVTLEVFPI